MKIKTLTRNFLGLTLFFVSISYSQNDAANYVKNHDNSPEADASLNSSSVDFYTGKLNTTIPLHTYKGRELDLPISMSYNFDGVQVEELSSTIGLGWNLNCGGRITTMINGEVDYH